MARLELEMFDARLNVRLELEIVSRPSKFDA